MVLLIGLMKILTVFMRASRNAPTLCMRSMAERMATLSNTGWRQNNTCLSKMCRRSCTIYQGGFKPAMK